MASNDVFTFLVTTDNHMGFKQDDFIRRKDSYMAFSEALKIGRQRESDFILLGGDLFHMNKPSASIEHKCIKIIRQHINATDGKKTTFTKISGNFSHPKKMSHPNFEDPNLTVSCPILTIHGNHDDPVGPDSQSVCEKLASCGLLNYFGLPTEKITSITIEPIILEKNSIKIALYGLGFISDIKLREFFDKGSVSFVEPPDDTFNVLVVHQNRVSFNINKWIPDELFPKYFHMIIRGHEHSAQEPTKIPDSKVDGLVYQPGSTVATSICVMEAGPKRVGLIKVRLNPAVCGNSKSLYKMDYELVQLKCCRRMILKDIRQREIFNYIKKVSDSRKLLPAEYQRLSKEYIVTCIKDMLEEDQFQSQDLGIDENSKLKRFKLPLVRIRLEYVSKLERFDEREVSSQFYSKEVANRDIILFKKQKINKNQDGTDEVLTFEGDSADPETEDFDFINLGEEKRDTIDVMIENYFLNKPSEERLRALSIKEYTEAVQGAQEDGNIISKVLNIKKKSVFHQYLAQIKDEQIAAENFDEESKIQAWFLTALSKGESEFRGGDEIDIVELD